MLRRWFGDLHGRARTGVAQSVIVALDRSRSHTLGEELSSIKQVSLAFALFASVVGIGRSQAAEFIDFGEGSPPPKVFIPSHHAEPSAPLIVVLHACVESADIIAKKTGFNEIAEKNGLYILYPNQQHGSNGFNCWNWFLSSNERGDSGEAAMVKAQLDKAKATYPIDPKRIYLVGWADGFGPILASCFPNEFAAAAFHSALPYGLASSIGGALSLMRNGPTPPDEPRRESACNPADFHGGLFVLHGKADQHIYPVNAARIISDFVAPNATKAPAKVVPPQGTKLGYEEYDWSVGGKLAAREVLVDGLNLAWSGGTPNMDYSDPLGPNAAEMFWSFFTKFSRQ